MRIAAVIPAYQAERTIGEALDSVLAQSRAADEIVVVDDGSSDRTAAMVEGFAGRAPRLRLLRQARAGPAMARNRAILATDCQAIAPIDADDLWHPAFLAEMAAALGREPDAAFVYCRHRLVDDRGSTIREVPGLPISGGCFGPMLLVNPVGNGSSAMFRRAAVLAAGGYAPPSDEWWGAEDYLLQLRLAARHRVARVDRVLSSYRVHAGSLSHDAAAARRARVQAIDVALGEFGPCPLPVRRWADGDGARVQAVKDLAGRRPLRALSGFGYASLVDPIGTLADLATRGVNLLARAIRPGRGRGSLDPLTASRLRRLARAMPFGRRARPGAADGAATGPAARNSPRGGQPPGEDNTSPGRLARSPG
jgi:hypothetical protein